jgi:hypothetical protein
MLEILNLERSRYYDRKKEAIMIFGLSLWGDAIPKLKVFLNDTKAEMEALYNEEQKEDGQNGCNDCCVYC